ncbi:MAG: hypothetical protein GOVbin2833_21 [Prokaryotic dsDNA virus sp.]|nr:MAG: hypothetical protein GOVbin2833_21 [Prokaryotic dsDNA virus sp.]|tara:strand:+ start:13381 stop:13596 length:216 start_codon:yes stop_codon:yes gene_type:complete
MEVCMMERIERLIYRLNKEQITEHEFEIRWRDLRIETLQCEIQKLNITINGLDNLVDSLQDRLAQKESDNA